MNWSLPLGKPFGIRLRAHWLFLAMLVWAFAFWGGLRPVLLLCFLFFFVVLHELGHSLVARRFGIQVRDITLLPIGGMARLQGGPPTPGAELWIALAGPAVNVVLAVLLTLLGTPLAVWAAALRWPVLVWLLEGVLVLVVLNVVLAVFNLLPAFPMDGGRVLRAWLARRRGMVAATETAARVGRWVALAMAVVGLLRPSFMLVAIALFIYLAGKQEEFAVRRRHAQAMAMGFDPSSGWRPHPGFEQGASGAGFAGYGPARGAFRVFYSPDPRQVEEALRRLKERLRRHE